MDENHQRGKDESTSSSINPSTSDFKSQQLMRYPEFWNSRGNIGEKINIITGLVLVLLQLVTTIIQYIGEPSTIPKSLRSEIKLVENYIHQLLIQPVSGLKLLEKIEGLEAELKRLQETMAENTTKATAYTEAIPPAGSTEAGIFLRKSQTIDKWGIIESIESLISSYSALSHLGFPNYYLAACKDLLSYEIQPQYSHSHDSEILQIPTAHLRTIISKLLREAPSARLLQNLKKMFPDLQESEVEPTDLEQIRDIISRYYIGISQFLIEERSLQDSQRASRILLQNYNLGGGDLESRIPNVSFSVAKDIYADIERATGNDLKQYILSETLVMISRLNESLLHNKRYVELLRRLK
ncbi:MAG: hypothetical protein ACFFE8_00335 [Candidatus Heimdallarchaeota archaeon]